MSEGYGKDFTFWDNLVKERFKDQLEKLGTPRYRNWEVFKSPKGRWMAFHNKSYSDIKIVDLETLEPVIPYFYGKTVYNEDGSYNKDESVYDGFHTNVTSFVPTYLKRSYESNVTKKEEIYYTEICEIDESFIKDEEDIWAKIISVPLAFNAYTYWAADFELYVDVIDLSEIDNGIIKKFTGQSSFIIPHGANRLGNYVKCDLDYYIDMKPKEGEEGVFVSAGTTSRDRGEFHINFNILEEKSKGNLYFNDRSNKSVYKIDETNCEVENCQPWEEVDRKQKEYKAKNDLKLDGDGNES